MKYGKLRIAWSVLCGILCLLLIALWVRSYWWWDGVSHFSGQSMPTTLSIHDGVFTYYTPDEFKGTPTPFSWSRRSEYTGLSDDTRWSSFWARVFPGFHWQHPFWVQMPIWFFVLVSPALAAAPWFRW